MFEDEEFLRQKSREVDFEKDDIAKYISDLKEYCSSNVVYALAPVQIGIPKRIIYIKNSKQDMENNKNAFYDEEIIYINPKITKALGHTRFLEGCESCSVEKKGERIYHNGVVDRPYRIDVEYYDSKGEYNTKTLEGFEVTVFCHEYDHLNGIVHLDKTKEVFIMKSEEMQEYRALHPYEVISMDDEFEI